MSLKIEFPVDASYDYPAVLRGSYAVTHFYANIAREPFASVAPEDGDRTVTFEAPIKADAPEAIIDGVRALTMELFHESARLSHEEWTDSLDRMVDQKMEKLAQLAEDLKEK